MFDSINGGLRGAPKFPQPAILEMLWRAGLRTKDARFFETVEHTPERMREGGIYHHLGGGSHAIPWTKNLPHFEKMLYDNAQLLNCWRSPGSTAGHSYLPGERAKPVAGWRADD